MTFWIFAGKHLMLYQILTAGIFLVGMLPQWSLAQGVNEEDFPPGFLARYTVGEQFIERIDRAVAFDWSQAAPDPRLPEGPFSAQWEAELLVRESGKHQLHAFVQGEVEVTFDGTPVLKSQSEKPGWVSGKPFDLKFGDQSLVVRFQKTKPTAQLKLFWSSESFLLEPLPAKAIYRDGGHPKLDSLETGRVLFHASRCNRCHQRENTEPALSAPALTHLNEGTNRDWLVEKIQKPHNSPNALMPDFGFTKEQAEQITAYLIAASDKSKLVVPKPKDRTADTTAGQLVFRSVGCFACHTMNKEGQSSPFGGGDLSRIAQKRSEAWLFTWLTSPKNLNIDHHMPLVKLSATERRQLAVYLSGKPSKTVSFATNKRDPQSKIASGKKLIEAARCSACHRIPQIQPSLAILTDLSKSNGHGKLSCLKQSSNPMSHQPAYMQLNESERIAIQDYLTSQQGNLSPLSEYDRGQIVLEQKNCLMCHERNHSKGIVEVAGRMARIDEALQGQSEALIPPALNAVGDKLLDTVLEEAISGEQLKTRLPWLKVRMPKFEHTSAEKSALVKYFIAHDRVPDNAPGSNRVLSFPANSDALVTGHTLVGAKGFSCVACHRVGSFEPRNVALGTKGSDLLRLGKRMRKSYYLRWTQSPQRIVPGMEMPSVRKAVPGVLDQQIVTQLAATWDALNDPRFTAPTSPSAVEQFLVVPPEGQARIVRDVFTNPKPNGGGYIARAMAMGFHNGHNLLFDLDNFTLRDWTFGDFARQRTEGKSWYWDMAGVPVMQGFTRESDFALNKVGSAKTSGIHPLKMNNTCGRLISYQNKGSGVLLEYELYFLVKNKRHVVNVKESIQPKPKSWQRELRFRNLPEGYEMLVATNLRTQLVGKPKILDSQSMVVAGNTAYVASQSNQCTLTYRAELIRPKLPIPPQPDLTVSAEAITSLPGYTGTRLPLPGSIMPTAITWANQKLPGIAKGTLIFTSLKGDVYLANDTNGDGLEDKLTQFEEGLAAPYGVLPYHRGLLVAHKPELLYLEDIDGDGRADVRHVVATGWGYSDNYHDWTTSLVRDSRGRFYVGIGSDYAQRDRPKETSKWRGAVLQITPSHPPTDTVNGQFSAWSIQPVGQSFRYPTGIAINHVDQIFVTDNQGVQNTFNEFNHLVEGRYYGVPSRYETNRDAKASPPAVQIPHPWSRSVNGVFFLPDSGKGHTAFRGHAIGCEYDTRFLIRLSAQKVKGEFQGAAYYFSQPNAGVGGHNFQGPLCGGVSQDGNLYIGSIYDSGWLGGRNTGDIVRLIPNENLPTNGIREVRATANGFDVDFLKPVELKIANDPNNYEISGYTRDWKGGYATPDSGRHKLSVSVAKQKKEGRTVSLIVPNRREGYVYEISCGGLSTALKETLFPSAAHYTLHKIPKPE